MKLYKKTLLPLLLSISMVACGSPESHTADKSASQAPTGPQGIFVPQNVTCEKSAQNGFYQAILMRNDGNCPNFDPFIIQVTNGEMSLGGPCDMRSISFTENECVQESIIVCEGAQTTVTFDTALAQLEESGSILVGATKMVRELEGEDSPNCSSGYRFKIERIENQN